MHRDKLRVLVLGGGPSAEHEVSLKTADQIFQKDCERHRAYALEE